MVAIPAAFARSRTSILAGSVRTGRSPSWLIRSPSVSSCLEPIRQTRGRPLRGRGGRRGGLPRAFSLREGVAVRNRGDQFDPVQAACEVGLLFRSPDLVGHGEHAGAADLAGQAPD